MKILRNRKALSPVVASIILIAVTVAVSIAVAAWMGALTLNLTNTEQLTFTNSQWQTNDAWFTFTVKNTGSTDLSIQEVRIDQIAPATITYSITGSAPWTAFSAPLSVAKGTSISFNVTRTGSFSHGVSYQFTVLTAKGNTFGPYISTAP
jgi:flagellin-like protein